MRTFSSFNKLLYTFLAFIAAMILFRVIYSQSRQFVFLGWNIFLAWIPFVLSGYFTDVSRKAIWKQLFLFASWLVFFPNALYIVTDLIHLQDETNMPWWFDASLLFLSSFIGIMMAFVSLRRTELMLKLKFSQSQVNVLIPAILFLGSFGVYLGRFQRWNSWDVLNNPLTLSMDILQFFTSPVQHVKTWAITILFTAVYSMLYFFIKILPAEMKNTGQ